MLENKNPYDPVTFKQQFESTELCKRITADFDHISYLPYETIRATPRQLFGETWFFVKAIYYINIVASIPHQQLYDLGCGWNIFKRYFSNIVGVDKSRPVGNVWQSRKSYADIISTVNAEYIAEHRDSFSAVMSICALHFRPLEEIDIIVSEFTSMIAPGGRGYLSLNTPHLLEVSKIFNTNTNPSIIDSFIRTELGKMQINFLVVDIDLTRPNDIIEGNINLVIEKPL